MILVKPIFAWYDFWVGAFWDRERRKLYILPIPMVGIVLCFEREPNKQHEDFNSQLTREVIKSTGEIARLQHALKLISNQECDHVHPDGCECCLEESSVKGIAEEALGKDVE